MIRPRLLTLVLIFIAVSSLALRPFPAMGLPYYGPGVKPGDEVTYGRFNFTSNLSYQIFPSNVTNLKVHVNTVSTQTKDVNASLIYNFQNGTQQTQQLFGNTSTGSGNLFPYLVAGNLTAGDALFNTPNQYTRYIFNETVQRQYAGSIRTVNLLNLTISQPTSLVRIVFYWDEQTGLLLEASEHSNYNGTSPQNFSIYFESTSTNIWAPSNSPDFTFDAASITTEIVHAGETANFHLDMSSINSFSEQINITAAPTTPTNQLSLALDQSTVTLTPTTTNATANLQVSASKTTPVGVYIISVNATSKSITHNDLLIVAVEPPDFTITASPSSLTLSEGTIRNSTLTITGRGGFSGTVGIQLQQFFGSPQINVQLSNSFVAVNATNPIATTVLTVDATFSLPGTTQVYMTANSGNIYRNLLVGVSVTGPDFRLTSTPASLTLRQGQHVQAIVQATSVLDFKGPIDLTPSSYGVTATLTTTTIDLTAGGNANITVTVSAPFGLAPGQYSVFVQGQDTRGLFREVYIPVTVTGPDFTITTDRFFASLRAGQSANFTLTLSTVDRFNGTITLSSSSYGSVLTSISPPIITLSTTHTTDTARVTVTVPLGATPSQFNNVNIQASSGFIQHYTSISIDIIGPDFSVTPNPATLSLRQGESGTSTLTFSSIENFTGTISLSTFPSGPISASINPTFVFLAAGGSANANLTVTVPIATLPGYYSVNVQATSGSLVFSEFVTVIVVGPDFTVTGFPTSLTIQQGQNANATVTLQSLENFTGTIKLTTFSYYPLVLSPNSTTVNLAKDSTATARFRFSAPQNAAPGFYNAQIQATSGSLTHTVFFSVQIRGPDFSIFPSPQSLTLKQGDTTTAMLFLNSIDGFAGNITLTTSAYGINVTPSTTTVKLSAGHSANTTINIQVPATTSIGNYYISINAVSGNIQRYSTVFVNVVGPDFSLLAFPSQLTIEAGNSATSNIQLSSLEGFTGNVSLTTTVYGANATGGPIFVHLNTATIPLSPGGTGSAILNITTTKAAAGTSVEIFITASGVSLTQNGTTFETHYTTVFASIIGPSFSLSASSNFLTLGNGGSTTATITASSIDNFSGQVRLTVGSQFGITAILSPQNLTLAAGGTSNSVLTISTQPGVQSGSYFTVTITGTGGNQTRNLYITVQVVTPEFTIQTNPSQLTMQVGRSELSTIQLTSLYGYHGNITLKAYFYGIGNSTVNLIHVTINPSRVALTAGGSAFAIANITATASAVGTNLVSIQGTDGNITRVAEIIVNVVGPAFGLSANPYSVSLPQGSTASTTITTYSIDNFTGIVHLAVVVPFGFTASFSPENVTLAAGGLTNSTLTFSAKSAASGVYYMIVTGTSGNITRVINIIVGVTTIGSFSITVSPSFLSIPPGGTSQTTVTLHGLAGFTGTISLSASSITGGATAHVTPESITLNSTITIANATVTITLPTNSTATFYTIQVTATGNGLTQTAYISVQLQQPDFSIIADPTNVTIQPPNSHTVKLTIVGTGGFNQTLHFFGIGSLQGFGITYSFSAANVTISPTNRVANVTATISVPRDVEPGVWEVDLWAYYNITAVHDEFSGHFAKIALTILPTPEFDLRSLPYVAYLYQGSSATVSSTLQSTNGFSGDVNINTTSVPVGISASPSSLVVHLSANQTVPFNITISAGITTATGVYVLKVDATITGVLRETQILVIVRARPDFTISAFPTSLTVQASKQGSSTITLGSLNFFNGTITLSTFGAPTGVSTSVSPSSVQLLPFGSMTSTLNISTTNTAKPGTYTIYITGNSTFGAHTINVTLTVTPPPDFKLSSLAAAMIIARGSQANTMLTLSTILGFNDPVTLTTSAPQGLTASYSANPLTVTSPFSTLTISVADTVATGNYKIVIIGTGSSIIHSVSINITVASAPKTSFTVTQTLWTHRLSLSKNNNLQTFTATIKNTGQSPAYIQLLAAGNSTSSSLFYNARSVVMMISPGQTITLTLTQAFNSSSIGQKYNVALQFFYGTMIDRNNNILMPTITTEAQGSFSVVK